LNTGGGILAGSSGYSGFYPGSQGRTGKSGKDEASQARAGSRFVGARIARLRDCLIENLRGEPDSPLAPTWRFALERANMALSFAVGVEYPITGIHGKLLEQAGQMLKELVRKVESVKAHP